MDNDRPRLDSMFFQDICPDKNGMLLYSLRPTIRLTFGIIQVPVIAVFTKFDQFKLDIEMKLEDEGLDSGTANDEVERVFLKHYLGPLGETPLHVRLESKFLFQSTNVHYTNVCPVEMHKQGQPCTDLISKTANSLSGNVVSLMLLAVQKDNLEPNVKQAINW
jgi:hypothetical protein